MNEEFETYWVYGHDGHPTTALRPKGEGARLVRENRERARAEELRRRSGIERENMLRRAMLQVIDDANMIEAAQIPPR